MASKKRGKKTLASAKRPAKARKAAKKAAARPSAKVAAKVPAAQNPWHAYADQLSQEAATTVKVMRAFPMDQASFQPHPRSSSALQLFHTFAVEQDVARMCINGNLDLNTVFSAPAPASLADGIARFEQAVAGAVAAARKARPADWTRPQPFFTGPKQMGQLPAGVIAQVMLSDQIHHRGQLSVYVRMAGGKVPSIYGPSADEPW